MQFERQTKVAKQYQVQMLNMIVQQVLKSVYQIKVVRVVLQVLEQNYVEEQINLVLRYLNLVFVKEGFKEYIDGVEQK